jgi:hypothetical protein
MKTRTDSRLTAIGMSHAMRPLRVAVLLVTAFALQGCEAKLAEFFAPVSEGPEAPEAGIITGTVWSSGTPLPGITVDLSGATTANTTTDASGAYTFDPVNTGAHTLSFSGFSMFVLCEETSLEIPSVSDGQTVTADLNCEDVGGIEGMVTLDGAPYEGIEVLASLPGFVGLGSDIVDASGQYLIEDLLPTAYLVDVADVPPGVQCSGQQNVAVIAGQFTQADFACVTVPPSPLDVSGSPNVDLTWVSSTCPGDILDPFTAPATFSATDGTGLVPMTVNFPDNPAPNIGEYDTATGEYMGLMDWVVAFPGVEARDVLLLTFTFDAMGNVVFVGTSVVDFRDEASMVPICQRNFTISGMLP